MLNIPRNLISMSTFTLVLNIPRNLTSYFYEHFHPDTSRLAKSSANSLRPSGVSRLPCNRQIMPPQTPDPCPLGAASLEECQTLTKEQSRDSFPPPRSFEGDNIETGEL